MYKRPSPIPDTRGEWRLRLAKCLSPSSRERERESIVKPIRDPRPDVYVYIHTRAY